MVEAGAADRPGLCASLPASPRPPGPLLRALALAVRLRAGELAHQHRAALIRGGAEDFRDELQRLLDHAAASPLDFIEATQRRAAEVAERGA